MAHQTLFSNNSIITVLIIDVSNDASETQTFGE